MSWRCTRLSAVVLFPDSAFSHQQHEPLQESVGDPFDCNLLGMTFWACGDGGFPDVCIPRLSDKEVGCGAHGLEMRVDLGGGAPKDFRLASSPCDAEFLQFELRARSVGLFLDGELSPFHDEAIETGSLGEEFGDDPGLKELGGVCRGGEPTCPKGFFCEWTL